MPFAIAINNAIILSGQNGYEPFVGSIGITDGRIAHIGERPVSPGEAAKRIDAAGHILMPGLVNGHCHGDMTFARGLGDGMTLQEQNVRFADTDWFHSLVTDDDRYFARQLTYAEALLNGTTFLNENMYWGLGARSAEAMAATGIGGALSEDVRYDYTRPDGLLSDEELAALAVQAKSHGLVPVIGSISEEDFSAERLRRIENKRRRLGLAITCHLAETPWRIELVRALGDCSPIAFLAANGCLHDRMIGSHVVWTQDEDVGLLARHGVNVVNTPICEMKIADGIARIPEMVQAGICIGIGTDGAMWNNSNDIFQEMKAMMLLHTVNSGIRSLKTTDVLNMATIDGARCFGLGEEIGIIGVGRRADLILIDARQPHMTPLRLGAFETVTSAVVFSATGRDVTDVFVGGCHVVERRQLQTIDLAAVMARVMEASDRIAAGLGG